jgi:hypothetical protein
MRPLPPPPLGQPTPQAIEAKLRELEGKYPARREAPPGAALHGTGDAAAHETVCSSLQGVAGGDEGGGGNKGGGAGNWGIGKNGSTASSGPPSSLEAHPTVDPAVLLQQHGQQQQQQQRAQQGSRGGGDDADLTYAALFRVPHMFRPPHEAPPLGERVPLRASLASSTPCTQDWACACCTARTPLGC